MSDISSIAGDAVSVYQRALGTISNNIANAATPGYSRQEISLQSNPVSKVGNVYLGTGVSVLGIKRQYDAFIEANYRNSNSDLLSQEPMVTYTNRVVDVLGSDAMGLSSALDQFFSSARRLSTDPASTALRGSFMGDANNLSSRFNELSSQLDLVQDETTQAVNSYVDQINTITSALAKVNGQLAKQKSLSAQPADLLDQRDILLKSLSDFAHVNTRFSENGAVTVSLGPSFVRDVVVDGSKSLNIGTNYNSAAPEKVSLVTDPYGKAESLTSITSGKLAGLLSFREQVLGSSRAALDTLAKSFVNEVNKTQNAGIDAYGNTGTNLFSIDPEAGSVAGGVRVAFEDPLRIAAAAQFRVAEAALNTSGSRAKVTYQPLAPVGPLKIRTLAEFGVTPAQYKALSILSNLSALDQNQLAQQIGISPEAMASLSSTLVKDGLLLAQKSPNDPQVQILSLTGPGKKLLSDISTLPFGSNPDYARKLTVTAGMPVKPVATLPNGLQNINLYTNLSAGQQLQIFTRDGRQLVGSSIDPSLRAQVINPDNGFAAGATYSDLYLNQTGANGYKGLTVFYGARADTRLQAQWDMKEVNVEKHTSLDPVKLPALLEGVAIPSGQSGTVVASGALTLNGVALDELTIPPDATLQASDISDWINLQVSSSGNPGLAGIRATASNVLKISPAQFNASRPLILNGDPIMGGTVSVSNLSQLAAAINGSAGSTHLSASIDADGNLLITNAAGYEGHEIVVGGAIPNALGLATGTYTGKVSITRDLIDGTSTPIEIGFGTNGTPDDLSKLGIRTQAYIQGQPDEDLLVFVTGAGEAQVSATYSGSPVDPKQALRGRSLQVRFDSATQYTIIDTWTAPGGSPINTEVASQTFDPGKLKDGISYQGLHLSFTSPPHAGDVFTIDGNRDGTGNNQNILDLVDLQQAPIMGSGKTFGEAYIDQVNDMGNVARQATIAQSALKVVNDQAVSARDQVSGVSMDQEAADLIRFQQAYQASAKVLQVASQIFDSILQVR